MLDTNVCIHIIRKRPPSVSQAFHQHSPEDCCVSTITYAELCHGISRSERREKNQLALTLFLAGLDILPFDAEAALCYGPLKASLEATGTPIGPLDTLIAAHALAHNLILVTNNTREFVRIPGLQVEDWVQTV